jgi:hypothetical protein
MAKGGWLEVPRLIGLSSPELTVCEGVSRSGETLGVGEDNRGGSLPQVQLGQHIAEVGFHSGIGDEQGRRDFGVGRTRGEFAENVALTVAEGGEVLTR